MTRTFTVIIESSLIAYVFVLKWVPKFAYVPVRLLERELGYKEALKFAVLKRCD